MSLDSSVPAIAQSGWSMAAKTPLQLLRSDGTTHIATLYDADGIRRQWNDPLAALQWMSEVVLGSGGRWAGYLSYELGRLFERLLHRTPEKNPLPLFEFGFFTHKDDTTSEGSSGFVPRDRILRSNFTRASYVHAVQRALDYISAGDIFQVNLAQRFMIGLGTPAPLVYKRLQVDSPARYGALLDFGDHALLCNSPELFLCVKCDGQNIDRRVITRPIKGTRPRGPGLADALRGSIKDQAELNMIVDLERNDLGRVCQIGTVRVTDPRSIEAHATVYHGVATIEGTLRGDVTFVDLLRATFPGGSITGAPKIRAMQIIDELEPTRRGPYCGAIGYLDSDGSMQFNIAIRTIVVRNGTAQISVGGGIVADSDPNDEYEETLVKARAMFAALGVDASDVQALP
jgi:para-aminobenzoate synthetase component 1